MPRKNIKLLNGKPLIDTIEAASFKYIDEYIISTDDQEITKTCRNLGAIVPFKRPENLSTDTASSGDALCHAVKFMEEKINGSSTMLSS